MYDNIGKLLNNMFQKLPLIRDDGVIIGNDTDQANIFAQSLGPTYRTESLVTQLFQIMDEPQSTVSLMKTSKVKKLTSPLLKKCLLILKSFKNEKSKGPDMILRK